MTVLMTTHHMDEADAHCDRLALMHLGHIRATGTPADLKASLGEEVSLDDVFRYYTGGTLDDDEQKGGDPRCPPCPEHRPPPRLASDTDGPLFELKSLVSRIVTVCWIEVCKVRHDRSELYTRAIQPALCCSSTARR